MLAALVMAMGSLGTLSFKIVQLFVEMDLLDWMNNVMIIIQTTKMAVLLNVLYSLITSAIILNLLSVMKLFVLKQSL